MTKIGVILRGKYGSRLVETVRSKTDMEVIVAELPAYLPDFIDEPDEFFSGLDFDTKVFDADIIITYSLHPDITPQIARMAGKAGVRALIVPGGASKAPVKELEDISKEYGIFIEVDEICCNVASDPATDDFTCFFGNPVLDVEIKDGMIAKVNVIRGAPCGSTWHLAEALVGIPIEEAGPKAGLIVSQYPCRAVRGNMGGIHESSEMHKQEIEAAIKRKLASAKD
ncbi:DUF166 domain-containing protein [Methanococcoides orientis]|uniref:DUF166 domain-containing protein n=1 Tax=Methanococcoides orientis TaxID=2822137 RepID=UPI001E47ACC4|nr:DUF166 domain-containing protein [Methanococcoides orientis]UGV40355.1 DUF166 domain-containing protein [Methanococcoides orientis]